MADAQTSHLNARTRRRAPTSTTWRKGQSGNPAGTWRKGESGNPLGRPPVRRATFHRQLRYALEVAAAARPDGDWFRVLLWMAERSPSPAAFTVLVDARAQARYFRLWWALTRGGHE